MKNGLLSRLLIAAAFIPLILVLTTKGGIPFLVFVELLTFLGTLEFCRLLKLKGASTSAFLLILTGAVFPISAYMWGEFVLLPLVVFGTAMNVVIIVLAGRIEQGILKVSSYVFGLIYIPLGFTFFLMIRQLPYWSGMDYATGSTWVIFVLLTIWSCDTLAYFVGRLIGKHRFSPEISPKKTWEGATAGFIGALLTAPLCYFLFFKQAPFKHLLVMSIIIGALGQVGDLLESLLKRDVDIKDVSILIPGHGGVLDRFDSLLFVSPLVYFYLKVLVYV